MRQTFQTALRLALNHGVLMRAAAPHDVITSDAAIAVDGAEMRRRLVDGVMDTAEGSALSNLVAWTIAEYDARRTLDQTPPDDPTRNARHYAWAKTQDEQQAAVRRLKETIE